MSIHTKFSTTHLSIQCNYERTKFKHVVTQNNVRALSFFNNFGWSWLETPPCRKLSPACLKMRLFLTKSYSCMSTKHFCRHLEKGFRQRQICKTVDWKTVLMVCFVYSSIRCKTLWYWKKKSYCEEKHQKYVRIDKLKTPKTILV